MLLQSHDLSLIWHGVRCPPLNACANYHDTLHGTWALLTANRIQRNLPTDGTIDTLYVEDQAQVLYDVYYVDNSRITDARYVRMK